MITHEKHQELETIIRGKSILGREDNLTAARNFLSGRFGTNTKVTRSFQGESIIKEAQKNCLIEFATDNNLWFKEELSDADFLTEGGEAKIHFSSKRNKVIKLNDAVYYSNWLDYLNSILIHNLLFTDTGYILLGFKVIDKELFAILEQSFIIADEETDLVLVRAFLEQNGFANTKRNDYYNQKLGLILEDMHDENVLVRNGVLFFIDTVFYIEIR
jgi:hypothetical protein